MFDGPAYSPGLRMDEWIILCFFFFNYCAMYGHLSCLILGIYLYVEKRGVVSSGVLLTSPLNRCLRVHRYDPHCQWLHCSISYLTLQSAHQNPASTHAIF